MQPKSEKWHKAMARNAHEKTYENFVKLTIYTTIATAVVLLALLAFVV